jgi:hypothetical protein
MIHPRMHQRWLLVRQILLRAVMVVVAPVAVSRVRVGFSADRSRSH